MKLSTFHYLLAKLWPLEILWVITALVAGLALGWWLWARAFHHRLQGCRQNLASVQKQADDLELPSGELSAGNQVASPTGQAKPTQTELPNIVPQDGAAGSVGVTKGSGIPAMPSVSASAPKPEPEGALIPEFNYPLLTKTTGGGEQAYRKIYTDLQPLAERFESTQTALTARRQSLASAKEKLTEAHRGLEVGLAALGSELESQTEEFQFPEGFASAASASGTELSRHLGLAGTAIHQATALNEELGGHDGHLGDLIEKFKNISARTDVISLELGRIARWSENQPENGSISKEHFDKAAERLGQLEGEALESLTQLRELETQLAHFEESQGVAEHGINELQGLLEQADRGVFQHAGDLKTMCGQLPQGRESEKLSAATNTISAATDPLGEAGVIIGGALLDQRLAWTSAVQSREVFQPTVTEAGLAGQQYAGGIEELFSTPPRHEASVWKAAEELPITTPPILESRIAQEPEIQTWIEGIRNRSEDQIETVHVESESPAALPTTPPAHLENPAAPVEQEVVSHVVQNLLLPAEKPAANVSAQRLGFLEAELGRLRSNHANLLEGERQKQEALRSELAAAQIASQSDAATEEILQLRSSLEDHQNQLTHTNALLGEERHRIQLLEGSLEEMERGAAGSHGSHDADGLRAELDDVRQRAAKNEALANESITDLRTRLMQSELVAGKSKNLEQNVASLEGEIQQLGTTAQELEANLAKLEDERTTREELLQQLQASLAESGNSESNAKERAMALEADLSTALGRLGEIERLNTRLAEAETYAAQREAEVVDLRRDLSELTARLASTSKDGDHLVAQREEQVQDSLARIAELEDLLGDRSREQARLSAELVAATERVGELELENSEVKAQANTLATSDQEAGDEAGDEVQNLQSRIGELEWLLGEKTAESEQAVGALGEAEQRLRASLELSGQHDALRQKLEASRGEGDDLRNRILQLDEILAEKETAFGEVQARVDFLEPIVAGTDSLDGDKDRYEAELDGLRGRISELEQLRSDAEGEVAQLKGKLDQAPNDEPRIRELETECDRLRTSLEGTGTVRDQLETIRAELAIEAGRAAEIEAQLQSEAEANASVTGLLQRELAEARKQVRERDHEIAGVRLELKGQVASLLKNQDPMMGDSVVEIPNTLAKTEVQTERQVTPQETQGDDLSEGAEMDPLYGILYRNTPPKRDDLELIKGVGPQLHEKLNQEGVYLYGQIAEWNPEQIHAFSELLAFSDRVERDQWVPQAKDLYRTKYELGEALPEWESTPIFDQEGSDGLPEGWTLDEAYGVLYHAAPEGADDLRLIWGIGNVLQSTLNKHGVFMFAQIASWKKVQVNAFSDLLAFKDRVHRDSWIKQARLLHAKKYRNGEDLNEWQDR